MKKKSIHIPFYRKILSPIKVLAFILSTFFWFLIYLILLYPMKLFGIRWEVWRSRCMRFWGRGVLKIFSMDLFIKGPPPKPPFFIVSNHLSYLDIPIYAAVIDTTFVSKSEIRHWPFVGWMAHMLGIIFINRKLKSDVKRVNNEITEAVENQGVLLFPEATTSPGSEILRFRSSLLEHAAEDNLAVSVAAIRYETEEKDIAAYRSVCWWGDTPLHTHLLTLGCTSKIKVEITFSDEKFCDTDRKILALKLEKKMKEMFVPVAYIDVEDYKPVEF